MATDAEQTFVNTFLNTLGTQSVSYPDDYQQPPQNFLLKIPVIPMPLPDPPRKNDAPPLAASITVTFKSLKPLKSFTLSVKPTDAISDIKYQLASQPGAPPADSQRLLLKGKALLMSKLLKEYDVKDGDTINLMVKPGFAWDASGPSLPLLIETAPTPAVDTSTRTTGRKHQRIPSVVLTPSASPSAEKPVDIPLSLDNVSPDPTSSDSSAYHSVLARPAFWKAFRDFLRSEFKDETTMSHAFEEFLCASKSTLTAFEIAKIRDELGIIGMAGL